MESRFVEANGVRMRWEESGEGPPVVFVHGIPPRRAFGDT